MCSSSSALSVLAKAKDSSTIALQGLLPGTFVPHKEVEFTLLRNRFFLTGKINFYKRKDEPPATKGQRKLSFWLAGLIRL
uniref:Uncharacterized protein n=1 Tax=Oryza rufipogon TaxID=4529 RepID=A0A0E0P5H4_ORYRU